MDRGPSPNIAVRRRSALDGAQAKSGNGAIGGEIKGAAINLLVELLSPMRWRSDDSA